MITLEPVQVFCFVILYNMTPNYKERLSVEDVIHAKENKIIMESVKLRQPEE
jgi:hypothetical protein